MQGIVLAAGRGIRFGKSSSERNKCLFEIDNKALIQHQLMNLLKLPLREIIIVVNFDKKGIVNSCGMAWDGVPIRYVIQNKLDGIVGAIESAAPHINDVFCLSLGDEYLFQAAFDGMYQFFLHTKIDIACGIISVTNPLLCKNNYEVISRNNMIQQLIEKPILPTSNIMGTGALILQPIILKYLNDVAINPQTKQRDLADWLNIAIANGLTARYYEICKKYYNINSIEDLVAARQSLER